VTLLVIPAKAGTIFGFPAERRHLCLFPRASRARGWLSLAWPRESHQREGHHADASAAHPCASDAFAVAGVRRRHIHVPAANCPSSCGASFGLSAACSPHPRGPIWRASCAHGATPWRFTSLLGRAGDNPPWALLTAGSASLLPYVLLM